MPPHLEERSTVPKAAATGRRRLVAVLAAAAMSGTVFLVPPAASTAFAPAILAVQTTAEHIPGTRFQDCLLCPEMVVVPAGSFMMGSPVGEGSDDERPYHRVTIARSFAVSRTEITFDQWDVCAAAGGCPAQPEDNGWGRGARPVTNISWNDTRTYLAWLSSESGQSYRLLSEAEWEYAARAGAQTTYSWGRDIGSNNANCRDCGSQWDRKQTAPVASFAANGFGLHDMAGNVLEWCEDAWHDTYDDAPEDGSVFPGGDPDFRILRGGSWVALSELVRPAYREKSQPFDRSYLAGLRVARALSPQGPPQGR